MRLGGCLQALDPFLVFARNRLARKIEFIFIAENTHKMKTLTSSVLSSLLVLSTLLPGAENDLLAGYTAPFFDGVGGIDIVAETGDGRVIVAGSFQSVTGGSTTIQENIVIVDTDGSIEGIPALPSELAGIDHVLKDAFDRIYIGGRFVLPNNSNEYRMYRLNADFTLDSSFVSPAAISNFQGSFAKLDHNELPVFIRDVNGAGSFETVTLNVSGTVSSSGFFNFNFSGNLEDFYVRLNGDLIIVGDFARQVGGGPQNPDIESGPLFSVSSGGIINGPVNFGQPSSVDLHELSDGSVFFYANAGGNTLVSRGGSITANAFPNLPGANYRKITDFDGTDFYAIGNLNVNGSSTSLAKLTADGSYDTSAGATFSVTDAAEHLVLSEAGNIWVAGDFINYPGGPQRLLLFEGPGGPGLPSFTAAMAGLPSALRGVTDDADNDGLPNGIEYLFGTDPGDGSASGTQPEVTFTIGQPGGRRSLSFADFELPTERADIPFKVFANLGLEPTDWIECARTERIDGNAVSSFRYRLPFVVDKAFLRFEVSASDLIP